MNQHQHSIDTTTGSDRETIEQLAEQAGLTPRQLTVETAFYLGQLEYAKSVAMSEGCGSGELPDRLNERVAAAEADLRMVVERTPALQKRTPSNRRAYLEGRRSALQFALQDFLAAKRTGTLPSSTERFWRGEIAACERALGELPAVEQPTSQDDDNRDTSHGQEDPAVADILATRRRYNAHHDALEGVPAADLIDELRHSDFRVGVFDEDEDGVTYMVTQFYSAKGLRMIAAQERLYGDIIHDEIPTPPTASEPAPAAPRRNRDALAVYDELYEAEMLLAFAWKALNQSPIEAVHLEPAESAGLSYALDRSRWIIHDQRKVLLGEDPAEGA